MTIFLANPITLSNPGTVRSNWKATSHASEDFHQSGFISCKSTQIVFADDADFAGNFAQSRHEARRPQITF